LLSCHHLFFVFIYHLLLRWVLCILVTWSSLPRCAQYMTWKLFSLILQISYQFSAILALSYEYFVMYSLFSSNGGTSVILWCLLFFKFVHVPYFLSFICLILLFSCIFTFIFVGFLYFISINFYWWCSFLFSRVHFFNVTFNIYFIVRLKIYFHPFCLSLLFYLCIVPSICSIYSCSWLSLQVCSLSVPVGLMCPWYVVPCTTLCLIFQRYITLIRRYITAE